MKDIEKIFFDKLTEDRKESANILEKPSMRGVQKSVVDKYSDQAHFIYELLQNADDAGATSARFDLRRDKLIFAHNGIRRFTVTNPDTENEDSLNGTLGDINAITSIANSNKTEASIGKFGVGFKAVFQYTATPMIFDDDIKFRIDRFIVPIELKDDCDERHPGETLFVFPFNHKERTSEEAYEDIKDKLKSLSYPILFLSNLKDISFEVENTLGLYGKSIIKSEIYGNTIGEKICLTQNDGERLFDNELWLFSRLDDAKRRYSVGFFLNDDGLLCPISEPAFCFFPTKETTGLNFLVHAPFLLTDSREGIKAGETHNRRMIDLLAKLAADSLVYLRDIGIKSNKLLINDDVVDLIPIDESAFNDVDDKKKISFKPFYIYIKDIMKSAEIIPAENGYTSSENAYWAFVPPLTKVFSDKQLSEISKDKNAKWVFRTIGRQDTLRKNKALSSYIDDITKVWIDEDDLIDGWSYENSSERIPGITAEFVENQTIEWLHIFYQWLSETTRRTESVISVPIFLDQDGKAVAAFDESEELILFLPSENIKDCVTINPQLLTNENTVQFVEKIGIKEPAIKDYIYNVVLKQYEDDDASIETDSHFKLFFDYYKQCPQSEVDEFIELIRDCDFVSYTDSEGQQYREKAKNLYFPTAELKLYFSASSVVEFVDYDEYLELVGQENEKDLISFLSELGIKKSVKITQTSLKNSEAYKLRTDWHCFNCYSRWRMPQIDGCVELVNDIANSWSVEKSVVLWKTLLQVIKDNCYSWKNLSEVLSGTYSYKIDGRYSYRNQGFDSIDMIALRTSAWLMDDDGVFVSAENLLLANLSKLYDVESPESTELLEFLGIHEHCETENFEEDITEDLSDEQRRKIEFANKFSKFSEEEINEVLEILEQRKNQSDIDRIGITDEEIDDVLGDEEETKSNKKSKKESVKKVVKDIISRSADLSVVLDEETQNELQEDEDEYIRPSVNYSEKIEREKAKSIKEIEKIAHLEELQQLAMDSGKYSFGWFKALLEIETLNSQENSANSKEVSISFAEVEREPGTKRTLILKHPNRYIPQFMEDLADIPLVLHFEAETKKLAIEVVNVKSYTLRVKLKSNTNIDDVDLSQVTEARIDAQSPVFLLEELKKAFCALDFDDDHNLQENLCENIDFIFGPPGTGKTTHLAKDIILPIIEKQKDVKVLVLTPTNKAADVLVNRIMDCSNDDSYKDWLVRFGGTTSENIENSGVCKDKTFDIRELSKSVTVTTIARFPYDFFMPYGERLYLKSLNWDYIIIDEASMIPLINIIYPLYLKTPQKFIIAGDPFQIEPITTVDLWKNENIYTMVHLDSFTSPDTIPHKYHIELLTTQYRSIPAVGEVFSKFAYGGILKHYRDNDSQRKLNIGDEFDLGTLNIIKFPTSKFESVYRPKRLKGNSTYQVYSALFTREFIIYLSELITKNNSKEQFRIGVITPYRAQGDLIDKLLNSHDIPHNVDVQVGTIHGFQGDECDIIIAVFNPPPYISTSREMFLNKKNIINVSISRAKDYLFVIMPDDETENVENLRLVKRVENLFESSTEGCKEYSSHEIENIIFKNSKYIEENSFSTSHQNVNVYGLPEKRYEIRSEDSAVDIQIHENRLTVETKEEKLKTNQYISMTETEQSVVEFYWLTEKTNRCPFDGTALGVQAVPVNKLDGKVKKINMHICKKCQNKFITVGCVPESIKLSEFCVRAKSLDKTGQIQSHTTRQSENVVTNHNSPYKTRTILPREKLTGKKVEVLLNSGERVYGQVSHDDGMIVELVVAQKDGNKKAMKLSANESTRKKRIKVVE